MEDATIDRRVEFDVDAETLSMLNSTNEYRFEGGRRFVELYVEAYRKKYGIHPRIIDTGQVMYQNAEVVELIDG